VVDQCYATGAVTSVGRGAAAGGLLAQIDEGASITNSYATGSLSGREYAGVGGLVGTAATSGTGSSIGSSYSTGVPTGGRKTYVGGFLGLNDKKNGATMTHAYWDTTTSGTDVGVGQGSDAGLTGLTTEQLQSGLPAGFDPKIWNEDSSINNGLPYLIANPPPN
jgi:hypothetical protein